MISLDWSRLVEFDNFFDSPLGGQHSIFLYIDSRQESLRMSLHRVEQAVFHPYETLCGQNHVVKQSADRLHCLFEGRVEFGAFRVLVVDLQ